MHYTHNYCCMTRHNISYIYKLLYHLAALLTYIGQTKNGLFAFVGKSEKQKIVRRVNLIFKERHEERETMQYQQSMYIYPVSQQARVSGCNQR